jgi:hypothetical protein
MGMEQNHGYLLAKKMCPRRMRGGLGKGNGFRVGNHESMLELSAFINFCSFGWFVHLLRQGLTIEPRLASNS